MMKPFTAFSGPALALTIALAACSPGSDAANDGASNAGAVAQSDGPAISASPAPQDAVNATGPAATPTPAPANQIGLEGLGELRIGQPVPRGGSWAERGAQTSDACRTVSSPRYPGVYAIVSEGKVQRITAGRRSDVRLAEGIGVGASEKEVTKFFPSFRDEPHKYEYDPAKYLTMPDPGRGEPALRFEIGEDGKVKMIHVGTMPMLAYVEGCS